MTAIKTKPRRKTAKPAQTLLERALEFSKAKLEKLIHARTEYLMKLDEVNRQIPQLQRIVSALEPSKDVEQAQSERIRQAFAASPAVAEVQTMTPPPPPPQNPPNDQENFLAKFMPRASRATTTVPMSGIKPQPGESEDPDEFLTDAPGQEILS